MPVPVGTGCRHDSSMTTRSAFSIYWNDGTAITPRPRSICRHFPDRNLSHCDDYLPWTARPAAWTDSLADRLDGVGEPAQQSIPTMSARSGRQHRELHGRLLFPLSVHRRSTHVEKEKRTMPAPSRPLVMQSARSSTGPLPAVPAGHVGGTP